ncbi:MAG TPA: hypothetical protein VK586_02565 [Streptosporangiaceae bacterium]|nr:hypothetical protein [Streptosporangiaceae bacterium]
MKTPGPQRAASRRALAAKGQALAGGTAPVPNLDYLRKAIRAKGRVDPAKWPALAALIRKRARELHAENAAGVKGTWAFQGSAPAAEGVDLAMKPKPPARMPVVHSASEINMARSGPDTIACTHKPTGRKIGTITRAGGGWQATHATGAKAPASGMVSGAVAGLVALHNKLARGAAAATPPAVAKSYATPPGDGIDLAGALPHSAPAASAGDGPRVTGRAAPAQAAPAKQAMTAEVAAVYRKLLKRGMKPAAALAVARRAAAMHARAAGSKTAAA